MSVKRYQNDFNRYQSGFNIYIENLNYFISEEILRQEFLPFGRIKSVKIMREAGVSKGFGFVCFSTLEEATKAMIVMHDQRLGSRQVRVFLVKHSEYILSKYEKQTEIPTQEHSDVEMSISKQLHEQQIELLQSEFLQILQSELLQGELLHLCDNCESFSAKFSEASNDSQERKQMCDVQFCPHVQNGNLLISDIIMQLEMHQCEPLHLCNNCESFSAKLAEDITLPQEHEQMSEVHLDPHVHDVNLDLRNGTNSAVLHKHRLLELCNNCESHNAKIEEAVALPQEQKQMPQKRLCHHDHNENLDLANVVTDMTETDKREILQLCKNNESLNAIIEEVVIHPQEQEEMTNMKLKKDKRELLLFCNSTKLFNAKFAEVMSHLQDREQVTEVCLFPDVHNENLDLASDITNMVQEISESLNAQIEEVVIHPQEQKEMTNMKLEKDKRELLHFCNSTKLFNAKFAEVISHLQEREQLTDVCFFPDVHNENLDLANDITNMVQEINDTLNAKFAESFGLEESQLPEQN